MEKVVIPSSLAFYNRLFFIPKRNNKWRPILDVCHLDLFLALGTQVHSVGNSFESQTHSRSPECHSRQAVIQTEWSILQEVFDHLCQRCHSLEVDLFATRFNHKLPWFVFPVLDWLTWQIDALNLPWQGLDAYAFPLVAVLGQVVSKLLDLGCPRMILIPPEWHNMSWFLGSG